MPFHNIVRKWCSKVQNVHSVIFAVKLTVHKRAKTFFFHGFNGNSMESPTMGDLMVVGFCNLQTLFGISEQFIYWFCNVFLLGNVRNSLWNGAHVDCTLLEIK